jgi:hypothetical protein
MSIFNVYSVSAENVKAFASQMTKLDGVEKQVKNIPLTLVLSFVTKYKIYSKIFNTEGDLCLHYLHFI